MIKSLIRNDQNLQLSTWNDPKALMSNKEDPMGKKIATLGLMFISLTAFADNIQFAYNVSQMSCEKRLEVLLDVNSEADRLGEAAFIESQKSQDSLMAAAYEERTRNQIEKKQIVMESITKTCFKKP